MAAVLGRQRQPLSMVARVTSWPLIALATLPFIGYWMGGGWWHWLGFGVFLVAVVLDPLVGPDEVNHDPAQEAELEKRTSFRVLLWLILPAQLAVAIFAYWLVNDAGLSAFETAGVFLSSAICVGFGATSGHELAHHPSKIDRGIGILLFMPFNMCDFAIYHNYGHHNRVATPADPGSAKYGENVWVFGPRSIWKKTLMGWEVEIERLRRQGLPAWHWRNAMIWMHVLPLAWVTVMTLAFGWMSIPLFVFHFVFARGLLAVADYLEHYGLARRRLADGSWEPVRPEHAWDDSFLVSSLFFCQIDRHSDHHANVGRPYQILRVMPQAPRLPYGYLVMIWIAMIPPLWRRMMHPRLEAFWDRGGALPHGRPEKLPEKYAASAIY